MKTKFFTAFVTAVIFLTVQTANAQPGCPSINAGSDQTLDCATPCTNLTSSVLATGATTSYAVSSIPYTPPYPYNTGTPILVNIDDTWSSVITLPFTFCFWGTNYNSLIAGSNGVVSFNTSSAGGYCNWPYTVSCPNSGIVGSSPGPFIFGIYHDIDPSVYGNMYYAILGTYPCRTFVVSWNGVAMYSCNSLNSTHQIVIYESTNVVEVYVQNDPVCSSWNSGNSCIGVQNAAGSQGVCPPGRNTGAWTASNEAWRFTPNGTPNYTTTWSTGGNVIATNTPTINVCPTATTTYTAQVVYDCCTGLQVTVSDDVTVNVSNSIGLSVAPSAPSICTGDNVNLVASCTDNTATYQWSNGGPASSTWTVSPTTTTTYTVTATTTMCTTFTPVTVTVNPLPPNTASNSGPICSGSNLTLSYPEAGDTYSWTGPNGFTSTDQNPVITGATTAASGTYTVSVTTAAGCSSTAQTTATVNANPSATASSNSPVCTGVNLNLLSSGGTSYLWTGPNSFSSSLQNPVISGVTTAAAGTYIVTVTGTGGCTSTNQTVVVVNTTPTVTASSNSPICSGSALNLTSGGGTGFIWSGPNGFSSALQNPTIANATAAASGTYTVTVTGSTGCTASLQTSVTVNPLPVATATSNTPVCYGHTLNLHSGGGTSYIWSGPNSFSSAQQNPVIANVSLPATGLYSVTVTGAGGCNSTAQTAVTINPNPHFTANIDSVLCHGGSTGSITLNPSGGTLPYTYIWNPGVSTSPIAPNLLAGTYHVTITDAHGCDTTAALTVYQPQDIIVNLTPTNQSCPNSCDGHIQSSVVGGTGSYTYVWSNTMNTPNITGLCNGNYLLTVTDVNGCFKTSSAPISTSWSVNADFTANPLTGVYPLSVNFTFTGTGAAVYTWNFGDNGTSNLENPTHIFADSGLYHVTLIVNSGNPYLCTDTFTLDIDVLVPSEITVPNVFTPNGDGKNETFIIPSKGIDVFNCQIYNRWGKKIFEWSNISVGWDGKTTGGAEASDGVYYYILYARGFDKLEYNQHGTVTLLR